MRKQSISLLIFAFLVLWPLQNVSAQTQAVTTYKVQSYEQLVVAIRETRAASQARIQTAVEQEKVREAWETGKLIDQHVLLHQERADYGEQVIDRLSKDLGMSKRELHYRVKFARTYPIVRPAAQLSWSHYEALLSLNDPQEREEIAKEAEEKGWGRDRVREEVSRRKNRREAPTELPVITPGPLNTYQIVRLKDGLKIDLGFGVYYDIPQKAAKKFKEGDVIQGNSDKNIAAVNPNQNLSQANLYTYSALVTQVVDGDTFHALIDLGFGITMTQRVRLRRIDAPDVLTAQGKEAKTYLQKILFRDQGRIFLQSRELDQHGRPIADVWVKNKSIDQEMLDKNLAVSL